MKRRQGFTLVELMVSMALIIFIMAILSQAFVAALSVFRDLKGQGDLAEKLRATAQILQRDLAADHFDSNRRLSDPTFWNNGPPLQGFFQLWQGSATLLPPLPAVIPAVPASYTEGYDLDIISPGLGIGSYLTTNHALAFTVKLAGNNMGDFMTASPIGSGDVWIPAVPPSPSTPSVPQLPNGIGSIGVQLPNGTFLTPLATFGPPESRYQLTSGTVYNYNYQWAEVAWFLAPQINPTTTLQDYTAPDPTAGTAGVPLYTLYRRQRLLVPDNNLVALATTPMGGVPTLEGTTPSQAYYLEMSCWPNTAYLYFNNPTDVTVPQRRLAGGIPTTFSTINAPTILHDLTTLGVSTTSLAALGGADIQMNDVVSFDVRLLPMYPILPLPAVPTPPNPADPFVTLYDPPFSTMFKTANATTFFDTWSSVSDGQPNQNYSLWATTIPFWTTTPLTYQYPVGTVQPFITPITGSGPIIRAVQITIRIWDFKTNQTRQVTIMQAM